jgi:hypothetical protein
VHGGGMSTAGSESNLTRSGSTASLTTIGRLRNSFRRNKDTSQSEQTSPCSSARDAEPADGHAREDKSTFKEMLRSTMRRKNKKRGAHGSEDGDAASVNSTSTPDPPPSEPVRSTDNFKLEGRGKHLLVLALDQRGR